MIQYTNRGVGLIPPRMRFNCRPEISVFTLRSKHVSAPNFELLHNCDWKNRATYR